MSEEEQDRQHGDLLVRERKLKKKLVCLQSKARQTYESLYIVLGAIRGCEIDFAYVKKTYQTMADTDIGELISEIEATCNALGAVQEDIRKIESPA